VVNLSAVLLIAASMEVSSFFSWTPFWLFLRACPSSETLPVVDCFLSLAFATDELNHSAFPLQKLAFSVLLLLKRLQRARSPSLGRRQ